MKTLLVSILLSGLVLSASAQLITNVTSKLKTKITLIEGKGTKHGSSAAYINLVTEGKFKPDARDKIIKGTRDSSELHYRLLGKNQGKDIYHFSFTRFTTTNSTSNTTTSKEVQFDGKRVVVFEDELHTVIMESPSPADLKEGQEALKSIKGLKR